MRGIFAGSFDPPTKGHEDIILRSAKLFDEVIVLISPNSLKSGMFSNQQRKAWLEEMVRDLDNVKVEINEGLTVHKAHQLNGDVLIRSMRNETDFAPEANNAWLNLCLEQGMDTMFLMGRPEHALISSSNVRELLKYHQSIEHLVPQNVFADLQPELLKVKEG